MWKRVPADLGFLLLGLPIASVGFSVTLFLFSASVGLIITVFIGLALLVALLYTSRAFGNVELARLEWAGEPPIRRPEWRDPRASTGLWGRMKSVIGNGHYWLYFLHTVPINFIVSLVTWVLTITWVAVGLNGFTYWFWSRFLPQDEGNWTLGESVLWLFGRDTTGVEVVDTVAYLLSGVIMIATLPFVTRGLVSLHRAIARALLGASRSDELRRQVIDLGESRDSVISAEGHSLRRLERDIHDGPQQRLVRVQMDLAAAERHLGTDPDASRQLIADAMGQSREALDELRALSRGFAPPILLDRGLAAALESVASRSPLAVSVTNTLADSELSQEVERNAYFVASELLTNAAKHSGASEANLQFGVRDGGRSLDLVVSDNGLGGAVVTAGGGLAGLVERLRGIGGTLELRSPEGGPTVVTVQIPVV
jgi:signal transduction histidine kinase